MKAGVSPVHDFSGRRFLVAEDIRANREIAAELLKRTGAAVEFAEDGQRCVERVASAPTGYYDLILMDINMPVMDGLQATKTLRQMGFTLPIIAMTANTGERERQAALEAGMDAFTAKPIRVEALFSEIARCLGR